MIDTVSYESPIHCYTRKIPSISSQPIQHAWEVMHHTLLAFHGVIVTMYSIYTPSRRAEAHKLNEPMP